MRWLAFFILAYIVVGLQSGLQAYLALGHAHGTGIGPNLVLLAVVFIAINAPRREALLGCLILGAMQDLVTQEPFGLYAFGYGLVGVLLNGVGRVVNRAHPLTHVVCVGMAGLMMGAVVWLHGVIRPEGRAVHPWLLGLLGQAVYTTILGLGVLTVLQRMGGAFGFAPTRRRGY